MNARIELIGLVFFLISGFGVKHAIKLKSKVTQKIPDFLSVFIYAFLIFCLTVLIGLATYTISGSSKLSLQVSVSLLLMIGLSSCLIILYELFKSFWDVIEGLLVTLSTGMACWLFLSVISPVLSPDSFDYVFYGRLFEKELLPVFDSTFTLYSFSGIYIQGFAKFFGAEYFLLLPNTLAVLSLLPVIYGIYQKITKLKTRVQHTVLLVMISVLINYFFVLQLAYLNSHVMMLAALTLVSFKLSSENMSQKSNLEVMILTTFIAVTRPEGALLWCIIVFVSNFSVGSFKLERSHFFNRLTNFIPLLISFLILLIWNLKLLSKSTNNDSNRVSTLQISLILFALTLAFFLRIAPLQNAYQNNSVLIDRFIRFLLLVVGLLLTAFSEKFRINVWNFYMNLVYHGGWGFGGIALLSMTAWAWLRVSRQENVALSLMTTLQVSLIVILGFIREFPFRLGWGDSGNRMLFQMLGVIVLMFLNQLSNVHQLLTLPALKKKPRGTR